MSGVEIIGSSFRGRNQDGDFSYMIERKQYADALFIFNDNEEDHRSSRPGGGNAAIRPYNKYSNISKPRSAGIPTGKKGRGYSSLTPAAKAVIDNAMDDIRELICDHGYQRVYFSADEEGKLGTSIFTIGEDVREYITDQIRGLENINP